MIPSQQSQQRYGLLLSWVLEVLCSQDHFYSLSVWIWKSNYTPEDLSLSMLPHTVCNPYSAANNKCGNPHLKLLPGFSWWGKMVLRNTFSGVCSQFRDNYTFTVHHSNSHSSLQKFNRAWGSFESVGFCTSVYCKHQMAKTNSNLLQCWKEMPRRAYSFMKRVA